MVYLGPLLGWAVVWGLDQQGIRLQAHLVIGRILFLVVAGWRVLLLADYWLDAALGSYRSSAVPWLNLGFPQMDAGLIKASSGESPSNMGVPVLVT